MFLLILLRDLTIVNMLSAGAALIVSALFDDHRPDKDDNEQDDSEEPLTPEPTGGDGIDLELHKLYAEFEEKELAGVGIS